MVKVMSIYDNPEDEIERITKEREKLSEQLTSLLNWKQKRQDLVECEKQGHMWSLDTVKSDLWEVQEVLISCGRCGAKMQLTQTTGLFPDESHHIVSTNTIKWDEGTNAIKKLYGKGTE